MIKFNLHNVTNTENGAKARIYYSLDNHISGKPCVTLHGKDVLEKLTPVFGEGVQNDSDMMTDYHEDDRIRFFEGDQHYAAARKAAERKEQKDKEARRKKSKVAGIEVDGCNVIYRMKTGIIKTHYTAADKDGACAVAKCNAVDEGLDGFTIREFGESFNVLGLFNTAEETNEFLEHSNNAGVLFAGDRLIVVAENTPA